MANLGIIQGTVTLNGTPVRGATVIFHPIHGDEYFGVHTTTTDQNGHYRFQVPIDRQGYVCGLMSAKYLAYETNPVQTPIAKSPLSYDIELSRKNVFYYLDYHKVPNGVVFTHYRKGSSTIPLANPMKVVLTGKSSGIIDINGQRHSFDLTPFHQTEKYKLNLPHNEYMDVELDKMGDITIYYGRIGIKNYPVEIHYQYPNAKSATTKHTTHLYGARQQQKKTSTPHNFLAGILVILVIWYFIKKFLG